MPQESQSQFKDEELALDTFAKVVWATFLAEREDKPTSKAINCFKQSND